MTTILIIVNFCVLVLGLKAYGHHNQATAAILCGIVGLITGGLRSNKDEGGTKSDALFFTVFIFNIILFLGWVGGLLI
ncbi:MAG: hypothetical protein ACLPX5_13060 [Dissulfurispiraceae bacterium]